MYLVGYKEQKEKQNPCSASDKRDRRKCTGSGKGMTSVRDGSGW